MGSYLRGDFSAGWNPSADAFNAPKNGLLRMDNLVLDELGAVALRPGSEKINSTAYAGMLVPANDVHSLFTTSLNGTRYRMSGVSDAIYANNTQLVTGFGDGTDVSFGAHMGQILFANTTSKKKYDGTTVRTLGIAAPSAAPTLSVIASDSKTFATCASTELPVMTSNEGTQTFVSDRGGVASEAVNIAPDSTTGRGVSTKTWTAPQDFTKYDGGQTGIDDDLIDFYAKVTEPQLVTAITVMVDVNDGTFQQDWYEHSFLPGDATDLVSTVQDSLESNYNVEGADRDRIEAQLDPVGPPFATSAFVPSASTWNHFSVPRGTMDRHGLTAGKNWSTVIAVRVVVTAIAGGSSAQVAFDDIKITGGSARPLTGKFKAAVVAVYNSGTYQAKSAPSAYSQEIEVKAQGLQVTIDATTIASLDSQVNELWVYLMGGGLPAFYRFATSALTTTSNAFDYTSAFESAYFTSVSGLANYTAQFESAYGGTIGPASHNYSFESSYLTVADPVTISITTSTIEALAANLQMETDNTTPPDNIIGIEGPHFDRTLYLTATTIYPSRQLNPDSCSQGEAVTVGDAAETALWIKRLGEASLFVGTTRDVYRFEGDWTVLPDGSINVVKRPMHVSAAPVSKAVCNATINGTQTIVYLTGDGWHALGFGPLVDNAVDLLWRGYTRHGVSHVNITDTASRFRCAVAKNVMFAITPEGDDTTSSDVIHAYHFSKQRWYRLVYPQAFRSILAEADGTLIAGDSNGFVRVLDLATKQDDGVDIPVTLWTPTDDNGQPFTYKDAENLWMRCETGTNTATIAFHLNGNENANLSTTTAQGNTDVLNADVTSMAEFSALQLRITGSFNSFTFRQWGLRYLDNPVPQVVHDTGYVDLAGDTLKWVSKIWVKAKSATTLTVQPYWDGSAGTSGTVAVSRGQATWYAVPMGREDKGKVGRVVITSSQPSHVFWVRFEFRGSGKPIQKSISLMPEAA